jgi:hypothetical protein
MSDVPRWVCAYGNSQMIQEPTGNYVHIDDVEELLQQAEQRGMEIVHAQRLLRAPADTAWWEARVNKAVKEALAGAVQRVEALPWNPSQDAMKAVIIAAIKGGSDG